MENEKQKDINPLEKRAQTYLEELRDEVRNKLYEKGVEVEKESIGYMYFIDKINSCYDVILNWDRSETEKVVSDIFRTYTKNNVRSVVERSDHGEIELEGIEHIDSSLGEFASYIERSITPTTDVP